MAAKGRGVRAGQKRRVKDNAEDDDAIQSSGVQKNQSTKLEVRDETFTEDGRQIKRRRRSADATSPAPQIDSRAGHWGSVSVLDNQSAIASSSPKSVDRLEQTIYNESETSSDEDDDEDVDWNELLAPDEDDTKRTEEAAESPSSKQISIDLDRDLAEQARRPPSRRLPSTRVEKQKRLNVHKVHILSWMSHVYIRSTWCEDSSIQRALRPILDDHVISLLNPNPNWTQFDRSHSFTNGLTQASNLWRGKFVVDREGLRRPAWYLGEQGVAGYDTLAASEAGVTKEAFDHSVQSCSGSRDTGAELFCALLRSVGIACRLVCSIQVLPFNQAAAPQVLDVPDHNIVYAKFNATADTLASTEISSSGVRAVTTGKNDEETTHDTKYDTTPKAVRRLGRGRSARSPAPDLGRAPTEHMLKRRRPDSAYPVFWVEAFNPARQKWVPVDPLATRTVAKASKLEPPASDHLNDMTYVLAVDERGAIRDVTRRYAKAYNSKTRKSRVESTRGGEVWFRKALRFFRAQFHADRDAIEDAELARAEASEPMPRNVQDFKDHPVYALERHLKRNEVIHPRRQAGKLSVGKAAEAVESIFRRSDVHIVKSADKWYREGRDVKLAEQPLKYGRKRQGRMRSASVEEGTSHAEDDSVGLYAAFQTELYVPPMVVRGRMPRNAFGNLDVYVPSMIPPGAVHVRSSDAAHTARILRIDHAEAIVGFDFKGRKGTAVVRGVIVAKEHRAAMEETIEALRFERETAAETKRSAERLQLWKRFLLGLRIRERIMGGEDSGAGDIRCKVDEAEVQEDRRKQTGGFIFDLNQSSAAQPTGGQRSRPPGNAVDRGLTDTDVSMITAGDKTFRRDYFEPTVTSPWDAPGALGSQADESPIKSAGNGLTGQRIDELFEEQEDDKTAGGFLLEDNEAESNPTPRSESPGDEEAGEFSIDDDAVDAVEKKEPSSPKGQEKGGKFVLEEGHTEPTLDIIESSENKEARHSKDFENSQHYGAPQTPVEATLLPQSNVREKAKRSQSGSESREQPPKLKQDEEREADVEAHESDMERGSLLSHDPEDEDAEPEWLGNEVML